jgi:hypothetical protein
VHGLPNLAFSWQGGDRVIEGYSCIIRGFTLHCIWTYGILFLGHGLVKDDSDLCGTPQSHLFASGQVGDMWLLFT